MELPFNLLRKKAKELDKSEHYIESIIEYAQVLYDKELPVIFNIEHLGALMKVPSYKLKQLLFPRDKYLLSDSDQLASNYTSFYLKKRSGGQRLILAPHEDLKYIQKWIQINILEKVLIHESCKAFKKDSSIKDNALPHAKSDLILKLDLFRFFDTIEERRVFGVFRNLGYISNLAFDFARLCTISHNDTFYSELSQADKNLYLSHMDQESRVLPQGAPTSPYLANIVAYHMDKRITKLSRELGFSYTRYADDLTFSIRGDQKMPSLSVLKKIISEEGFVLNTKKIRFLPKGKAQYVTGLTTSNGININKAYRKRIERHLYFCHKYSVSSHLEKRKDLRSFNVASFHDWILGHLCFIKSINEKSYNKLIQTYKKINWFEV